MKTFQYFRVVIILGGIFLSACAGAPVSQAISAPSSAGGDKPLAEVVFSGMVEGMNGDQWLIDGQTVQVDSSVLRDGPFAIGDTVKVEALVAGDGSVTAQRIELPSVSGSVQAAASTPEPFSSSVSFDGSGLEAVGALDSLTGNSITVGGQIYSLIPGAEIKGAITVGTTVKLHFIANPDGTLTVREVEAALPAQIGGTSSTDDNFNSTTVTDDHSSNSNDDSPNDDHGNGSHSDDDSGSDDHGENSGNDSSEDNSGHG